MSLFSKKEKKNACDCKGKCNGSEENPRFIVLGACCKRSQQTFENTRQAVKELGFTEKVVNIGDNIEIAKYGVMQTPALVFDRMVLSYGKLLSVDEVKELLKKAGAVQ